jgi:hypothetical protein
MEYLVETLAIGLLVSLILIVISWWFWKRYDKPSEAQIEREESIAKKQKETQMWRAVEAQMAQEKAALDEQALYERGKAEERARALPPPSGEVSNAFAAFDMERQTPVKTFTENHDDAPSAEAALIELEAEVEADDDDVHSVDELVEVRQDQGVVFEEHQTLPELPSDSETIEVTDAVDTQVPSAPDLESLTPVPAAPDLESLTPIPAAPDLESLTPIPAAPDLESLTPIPAAPDLESLTTSPESTSELEAVTQTPPESTSEPEAATQTPPESTSEPEWLPDEEEPVETDWSDNWFGHLEDE